MAKKSPYHILKSKWKSRHRKTKAKLLKKHKEAITWINENVPDKQKVASAAIGALMLTSTLPVSTQIVSQIKSDKELSQTVESPNSKEELAKLLATQLPQNVSALTSEEEETIAKTLSWSFKIPVSATLEGKRLNRSYGLIGAEQHLTRYPGDTMATHLSPELASDRFIFSSGMAPGRGAWGYFTNSKANLGQKDIEREKWYIATQTFLAPGFSENVDDIRHWFKYRKMLVVNPKNGRAVVTDIADAGPAEFTGKHLGGSPEVMYVLGLHMGPRKGPVLYFFIDDPDDKIPLGPINIPQSS